MWVMGFEQGSVTLPTNLPLGPIRLSILKAVKRVEINNKLFKLVLNISYACANLVSVSVKLISYEL